MTNDRRRVLAFTFKLDQKQAQLRGANRKKDVPNVSEVQFMRAAVSTAARCCACLIFSLKQEHKRNGYFHSWSF